MPLSRSEKLDAKIANEQTKLLATLTNGLAGAVIVGGIVTPIVTTGKLNLLLACAAFASLGVGALLHLFARLFLHDLIPEE